MHAPLQPQCAGDGRHHRLVAVGADSHLDLAAEIDAVDVLEKAVDEVLAGLFAVADDVDAGKSSCSLSAKIVASRLPASSSAPANRHGAHNVFGSASQGGFGRLPAIEVANMARSHGRSISVIVLATDA